MTAAPPAQREPLLIDLALQGSGAHGAFTWGVLDRLLEEPWLEIDGISGTSAGAMNATVLVHGHASGGAEGARQALTDFWKRVSESARFSPFRRSPLDVILGRWTLDNSPLFVAADLAARIWSPYDLNRAGSNPLAEILQASIDFEALARAPIEDEEISEEKRIAEKFTPRPRPRPARPVPARRSAPAPPARACPRCGRRGTRDKAICGRIPG